MREKPETISRGPQEKYDFEPLQLKEDFIEFPKADSKQAHSIRTIAKRIGLVATVQRMKKGGYLVELLEDRK